MVTGLSRCGRIYATLDEAVKAADAKEYKTGRRHEVWPCRTSDHYHVVLAGRSEWQDRGPDPFPPPVAALLDRRDERCQRCGYGGRLERHHRRAKSMGGSSARSHTQCACNGVKLCRRCHEFVTINPRKGRAEGFVVLQSVSKPASVGIQLFAALSTVLDPLPTSELDGVRFGLWYPSCDGQWKESYQ